LISIKIDYLRLLKVLQSVNGEEIKKM